MFHNYMYIAEVLLNVTLNHTKQTLKAKCEEELYVYSIT